MQDAVQPLRRGCCVASLQRVPYATTCEMGSNKQSLSIVLTTASELDGCTELSRIVFFDNKRAVKLGPCMQIPSSATPPLRLMEPY